MSIFSVSGLSSGIDFANLTTKMIEFERRPINLLEAKQTDYNKQLETWNQIKSKISQFETTVNSMKSLSDFSTIKGSFSNSDPTDTRQTVSIISTGVTTEQSYDITVNQLAQNHRIMSEGVGSGSTLNRGTFSVTIAGTTTDFSIVADGQNNTLEKLRDSINSADIGVSASVINDGSATSPYHLVLTASTAGADNTISVQHNADPYISLGVPYYLGSVLSSFQDLQAGQDAEIDFGGQIITRTSNTISDLIDNTTIQIHNTGSGTLSFTGDTAVLKDKIVSFVEQYNETKQLIEKHTTYDYATYDPEATQGKGVLFGDSTLINVLSTFRGIAGGAVSGLSGTYNSIASIGITTKKEDGTLTIDYAKLDEAIANDPSGVGSVFAASGSSSNSYVSYIDHTRDTATSGTITVYYTGTDGSGNVQGYFMDSLGNTFNATGSGRFLVGSSGGASGLTVRINESATAGGSIGTITVSRGVADKFSSEIYNLNTFDGRFYDKTKNIEETIQENSDKIKYKLEILKRKEDEMKRRFANLEGILGAMQGQSEFIGSQLNNLQKNYR